MNNSLGMQRLLALQLAFLYQQDKQYDKAEEHYLTALKQAPSNEHVLLGYAKFLLRIKNDIKGASIHGTKAYSQQQNNLDTNTLMAEIAMANQDFKQAKNYLNVLLLDKRGSHKQIGKIMLADIAIKEKDFEQAKLYLKPYTRLKKGTYCLLYTSPSPRDATLSRMPSSA